jgi:hypothetical protein
MIATNFRLIPLAVLHMREGDALRRLDSLPFFYRKSLLDDGATRYPFLYYMLLSHWPELLNGDIPADELLYNRLYWFLRLSKHYQKAHDTDGGFEQRARGLRELAERELGTGIVQEVENKVTAEFATGRVPCGASALYTKKYDNYCVVRFRFISLSSPV